MENETFNYPTKAELLLLIAQSNFRPFEDFDWMTFSGCESKNPMIYQNDEYSIVIDNNNINMVYHEDMFGGEAYSIHEGY